MAWIDPRTWAVGELVTATKLNEVRDSLRAVGDPWQFYTPTLTAWTVSDGTLSGWYRLAGKTIDFYAEYVIGPGDTISGNMRFNLPTTALRSTSIAAPRVIGQSFLYDTSANARSYRFLAMNSATTAVPIDANGLGVAPTVPWTWAAGDIIQVNGTYEIQ